MEIIKKEIIKTGYITIKLTFDEIEYLHKAVEQQMSYLEISGTNADIKREIYSKLDKLLLE